MIEEQKMIVIKADELVAQVKALYDQGYRLVQIGATKTEGFEINYSFDKNYQFINLKIIIGSSEIKIPSITNVYWSAFLYENEIHDLFGITIEGIAVDYKGAFYRTSVKTPFGEVSPVTGGDKKNE